MPDGSVLDAMAKAKVEALGQRYALDARTRGRLLSLLSLLAGDSQAPTTVRDPARAADDHLADSLVALELEEVTRARSIVDVGSGAGFPGLALAVALAGAQVTLLESNARKCAFIERAAARASARNAAVVNARAEAWPAGIGRFDLATVRAVAPLAVVAEYAAPLLRLGGSLVAWRGRRDAAGELEGSRAAAELGLEVSEPRAVNPYAGADHRHLHVMVKVRETPSRFPRRPGVALKRPLGTSRPSV